MELVGQQEFFAACCYDFLLFREGADNKPEKTKKVLEKYSLDEKEEQAILCKACKNTICSPSSSIEVNGRHRHTFYNPEGVIYHIGCFAPAPGCMMQGRPTLHFTWFAGYSWNFALCANCLIHLGWYYRSEVERNFFGLILNKLA